MRVRVLPSSRKEGAIHTLFDAHSHEERLRKMSAERRRAYAPIVKLRSDIGPVGFSVVDTLTEVRRRG